MKTRLKRIAANVSVDTWERLLSHSIIKSNFAAVANAQVFSSREKLWDDSLLNHIGSHLEMTFVEFGVHEGYSMKYFSDKNTNDKSLFIGLDSFDGLPEAWGTMPKGSFDVKGSVPKMSDPRVLYLKGWFQDTADGLLDRISGRDNVPLLVHYDADLYSSTLFALTQIARLKRPYYAIFDEFIGHETRALYNFAQAFNAKVEFLGQTLWNDAFPQQVLCKISPKA